jgi:putative addiction module component (TIGR02574 family)
MTMPLNRDEIPRLTAPERLAVIGQLWDSLDDAQLPVDPAQRDELARSLNSFEQDRSEAATWEQLKAELACRAP